MSTDQSVLDQGIEGRQARLVGVQDNDGYHLCTGFVKAVKDDGSIEFEDEGKKVLTYGAYEFLIQDLEVCLAHAKAMRDVKIAERKETEAQEKSN